MEGAGLGCRLEPGRLCPGGVLLGSLLQAEGLAGYQVIPEDLGCELLERLVEHVKMTVSCGSNQY